MYNVSNAYKESMRGELRNPSHIKVEMLVSDPEAIADAVVTDSGHTSFSRSEDIHRLLDLVPSGTLEHNYFNLGGDLNIPSTDYTGFVGSEISDVNGNFMVLPSLTLQFPSINIELVGLTFMFDTIMDCHPKRLRVQAYANALEVYNEIRDIPSSNYFWDAIIPMCNKIVVTVSGTSVPGRRSRISQIVLGILKYFESDTVSDASYRKSTDILSTVQPKLDFDFTFLDVSNEFNPEDPTGAYSFLTSRQQIRVWLGYELPDTSIEWVKMCSNFTTGEVDVKTGSVIPKVTFKSSSILTLLSTVYPEGIYNPGNPTLYDLATTILTYADLPKNASGNNPWILSDVLKNYRTKTPLPVDEIRNLLQLIANAAMCVLDVDREGNITILPRDSTLRDFKLGLLDTFNPPTVSKYPMLEGVDTYRHEITIASTSEQLAQVSVTGLVNEVIEISYEMATDVSVAADAGVTITSPQYFARMCRLTVTGTGQIAINGYKLSDSPVAYSLECNPLGDRCPVDNPLINTKEHIVAYTAWIASLISIRNKYTVDNRGFVELDTKDSIKLETLTTPEQEVIILQNDITYNGAIKGKTVVTGG